MNSNQTTNLNKTSSPVLFHRDMVPVSYTNRYNIEYILDHCFSVADRKEEISTIATLLGISKRMFQRYCFVKKGSKKDNMRIEYLTLLKEHWGLDGIEDLLNPHIELS